MKTVALEKMELGIQRKSRRIFRRSEIRSFFEKGKAFKVVYGNEYLFLKPTACTMSNMRLFGVIRSFQ